MATFKVLTPHQQLALHLREQILRGVWSGEMPGTPTLSEELRVDHRTMIAAFRLLENEGLLKQQGVGRRRKIVLREDHTPPALRVSILLYDKDDVKQFYIVDLQHQLMQVGHIAGFAAKSMRELGNDTKRVIRFAEKTQTDAWVVFSGTREVLDWFAQQPKPALALAGRRREIQIAGSGPDKAPAMRASLRRLVALGHRRIVMLTREGRRKPSPGLFEREFLKELATHGILTGSYNLPDWKDNMEDFYRCLDSLFRHTPPTALLIDEMPLFIAAQQHLAQNGILAPRDVSLVCSDPDPAFAWCKPSVAHIHWEPSPVINRIIRWADNVARGKVDRRQNFTKAEFVEGGTIGPAPEIESGLR